MKEILKIFNYVDGVHDTPFYDDKNPIEITEYTYVDNRMGTISLTAKLMHEKCLDDFWDGTQYVKINDEKYFIKGTPSSSKNNDDSRYEHNLEFIDERTLKLSNTYFYDVVISNPTGYEKYYSNTSKVVFWGNIVEFAKRINYSLQYSGIDYSVVVDEGVNSEEKLVSFEDKKIFEVLQESFNIYEIPFYFVGKEIHFGFTTNAITHVFEYGRDKSLLSIKKNNANRAIVTRCTGYGSDENIPFYYPNNSADGSVQISTRTSSPTLQVEIANHDEVAIAFQDDSNVTCEEKTIEVKKLYFFGELYKRGEPKHIVLREKTFLNYDIEFDSKYSGIVTFTSFSSSTNFKRKVGVPKEGEEQKYEDLPNVKCENRLTYSLFDSNKNEIPQDAYGNVLSGKEMKFRIPEKGIYTIHVLVELHIFGEYALEEIECDSTFVENVYNGNVWVKNSEVVELNELGLRSVGEPELNDKIFKYDFGKITHVDHLMPPVFINSGGTERYYNAINDRYVNPQTGEKYIFENQYVSQNPKEQIVSFPEIKPTIKGVTNEINVELGTIVDVAFDLEDNDALDKDGKEYLHPYFYVRIPVFNGEYGFNLFDHAIEQQPMTIAMISGNCAPCKFTIGVDEKTQKNLVQVDEFGNLKRDKKTGDVLWRGQQPQEEQNDTRTNSVWLALKKDISTFGIIMPNATNGYRPNVYDKFVIQGISLPSPYIRNAEKKLEDSIIKYMANNNSEKFNFSINFSRIFLAEHQDIYKQLNSNARIILRYNKKESSFYISQFTYKAVDDESLPEISVELTEDVTVMKGGMQNTIDAIQQDIMNSVGSIDFLKKGLHYFIRKDVDDMARGKITFGKGIDFGTGGEGASGVSVEPNGDTIAKFDFLEVKKRAIFNEIVIQSLKHAGGQICLSPAALTCSKVEEETTLYRCYFDQKDDQGKEIFNEFRVGDLAKKQSFNAWGGEYYWGLVVGVGDNYIELSKTDCDTLSTPPRVGDQIVQMGNKDDKERQSVIILSTYGENAPSIVVYNGVNDYTLKQKAIGGIVYNRKFKEPQVFNYGSMFFGDPNLKENYITFQKRQLPDGTYEKEKKLYINANVILGSDSSGLSNLGEWNALQAQINEILKSYDEIKKLLDGIADDNEISTSEKRQLKQLQKDISTEYSNIISEAGNYEGISTTDFTTAWTKANDVLEYYITTEGNVTIDNVNYPFPQSILDYYTQREIILGNIETKSQEQLGEISGDITTIKNTLSNIASDNEISVSEKRYLSQLKNDIITEKFIIDTEAGNYTSIDTTQLTNKYNKAIEVIDHYVNTEGNVTIDNINYPFPQSIIDYYTERQNVMNLIEDARKKEIDEINKNLTNIKSDAKVGADERKYLSQLHAQIKAEYNELYSLTDTYGLLSNATWSNYSNAYNLANNALTYYTNKDNIGDDGFIDIITEAGDNNYDNIANYYPPKESLSMLIDKTIKDKFQNINDLLDIIESDGYVRPEEKRRLRTLWKDIESRDINIQANIAKYLQNEKYKTDVTNYNNYLAIVKGLIGDNPNGKYVKIEPQNIPIETDFDNISLFNIYANKIYKDVDEEINVKFSDIDFLNGLFDNAPGLVSNGAVIAKTLGVSDSTGTKIQAMINGSDIGKDATHGKLMIAAGMSSIQDPDSAKTKIYEDGHEETTSIEISGNATIGTGVKIGDTDAQGNFYGFQIDGGLIKNVGIGVSEQKIQSRIKIDDNNGTKVELGIDDVTAYFGDFIPLVAKNDYIGTKGDVRDGNIAFQVSASNHVSENTAIQILNGCVSGFAYKNLVVTESGDVFIPFGVNNVIVKSTSTVTLHLPSLTKYNDGYVIRIKRNTSAIVNLYASSSDRYTPTIVYNGNEEADGYLSDVGNPGDAWEMVYVRGYNYKGAWIQYKLPANW